MALSDNGNKFIAILVTIKNNSSSENYNYNPLDWLQPMKCTILDIVFTTEGQKVYQLMTDCLPLHTFWLKKYKNPEFLESKMLYLLYEFDWFS